MRAPVIAALVLALAAPAFPQTSLGSGPMPRPGYLGGNGSTTDTRPASDPSARNAARQVAGYNAKIRAARRAGASRAEIARLTTLRNRAAARLQAARYGGTEGVPHGTSIPARDR